MAGGSQGGRWVQWPAAMSPLVVVVVEAAVEVKVRGCWGWGVPRRGPVTTSPTDARADLSRRCSIHELRRLRLPWIYSLIVNEFATSTKQRLHPFIPFISPYCTCCFELGLIGAVQLELDQWEFQGSSL
jgi:hypothetical protein